MEKRNVDWSRLGFGYQPTGKRFVTNYAGGAWDAGCLTGDSQVVISECAGVLQYAQTCFEGLKAYTTKDGRIVCFRPELNARRMAASCRRLCMPEYPEEKFLEAVKQTVLANEKWVPPLRLRRFLLSAAGDVRHRRCAGSEACRDLPAADFRLSRGALFPWQRPCPFPAGLSL